MIEKMMESIGSGRFETDIYLQFTQMQRQEDVLMLICSIYTEDEDTLVEQWLIECQAFEEYRLEFMDSYDLEEFEVTADHPYLWDYGKAFTKLYFNGEARAVKALIGDLYLEHNRLTEGLIPFGRYLNIAGETGFGNDLGQLLNRSSGLFSTAPALLNEAYEKLLSAYGFSTTSLSASEGTDCINCRLLRLGKSYVIAKAFEAVRMDTDT